MRENKENDIMSQTPKARTIPQLREAAQADYEQHPPAKERGPMYAQVTVNGATVWVYMGVDHPESDDYD